MKNILATILLPLLPLSTNAAPATKWRTLTSAGHTIHYPEKLFSDAEKVAHFVTQAQASMIQEFSRHQPDNILKSIVLDVYLHDQPREKVSSSGQPSSDFANGTCPPAQAYTGMALPLSGTPEVVQLIRIVRGQRVIIDSDLARLYGVSTSRLNEQMRRNQQRFPIDFAFILTRKETLLMLSHFATALKKRNLRKPPIAYTEHGAIMAANVLNSKRAVMMSVEVVRAFIKLRRAVNSNIELSRRLSDLEKAVKSRLTAHDKDIEALFRTVESMLGNDGVFVPKRKIGFT